MSITGYYVSTDKRKLNIHMIHDFLSNRSHWAAGRSLEMVEKSIEHSLCFGVYDPVHQQVGFARIITDFSVYTYLLDLFILESHRGKGLSKLLMQFIIDHEELKSVGKWVLQTKDAHALYGKYGFVPIKTPERYMERII